MKWGVCVFPGSNDDQDMIHVLGELLGDPVEPLWHKQRNLQGVDAVILPGGFSYGDALRCGAIARFSPIMESVAKHAAKGGLVFGTCNGFQILCEAGLLPGALVRNRSLTFVCGQGRIRVENTDSRLTKGFGAREVLQIPIKHGEGCWVADEATIADLEANGQILFRYVDEDGEPTENANPNGSLGNVAGVRNRAGNVFGMMPHPEHAAEELLGSGTDGMRLIRSLRAAF